MKRASSSYGIVMAANIRKMASNATQDAQQHGHKPPTEREMAGYIAYMTSCGALVSYSMWKIATEPDPKKYSGPYIAF